MNDKLEEKVPLPENLENQKYQEFQVVMREEDRVMAEIDKVFASAPDRTEAEKIILEKWAPLMDMAMKKSGESLKAWLDEIREPAE